MIFHFCRERESRERKKKNVKRRFFEREDFKILRERERESRDEFKDDDELPSAREILRAMSIPPMNDGEDEEDSQDGQNVTASPPGMIHRRMSDLKSRRRVT